MISIAAFDTLPLPPAAAFLSPLLMT